MSLTNALFSSVSGLETASTQISVIGDNIANANTPGFKEKRAEFAAVLGQNITAGAGFAQIGAGALVNDVGTIFTQGVFENTDRSTDLAISGRGFFVLESNAGRTYTRSGIFGFDTNGFLVDPAGARLQGYGIDATTGNSNGVLGDIQVNLPLAPPQATSSIELGMNLNATVPAIPGGFDPADAQNTSSNREVVTIYDSLGSARQATIFFTKTATNQWDFNLALPDGQAGTSTGDPFIVQGGTGGANPTGTLTFDSDGVLTGFTINNPGPNGGIVLDLDTSNGAAGSQEVAFSMGPYPGGPLTGSPTTQVDEPEVTNFVSQDGFSAGALSTLGIDENGRLNAVFTNGTTRSVAQIALANFPNVEGLSEIGGSQLAESVDSGPPLLAAANTGSLGSIRASSLEKSNVDLAQQFVNLIVSQRAFQANTRTVSVANELMANLVSLGQ